MEEVTTFLTEYYSHNEKHISSYDKDEADGRTTSQIPTSGTMQA